VAEGECIQGVHTVVAAAAVPGAGTHIALETGRSTVDLGVERQVFGKSHAVGRCWGCRHRVSQSPHG
jgi:hypothetical protein